MSDLMTVERLARIEISIERMAKTLEEIARDHEQRLRALEASEHRNSGVIKLLAWIGAPGLVLTLVLLIGRGNAAWLN